MAIVADEGRLQRPHRDNYSMESKRRGINIIPILLPASCSYTINNMNEEY